MFGDGMEGGGAAKYAKTAGDGSGLVYDEFVREAVESGRTLENSRSTYLTAETAERINSVAKALGLRAQFVDSVEGGIANAQIQGDTVLIEKNNPNPVTFLMGHEITHRIQELAPEQYRSFRQFISENDADFQAQVEATQALYENHGMEISYEQAMDEAAADYAGRLMEDGTLLDEFIQKNRKDKTLLEKVRDAIRSLIDVLTGREKQQAKTAEGKLTAALEAAAQEAETISQRTENAAQEGGESRYAIKEFDGGAKYVQATRQVIFGNDPLEWKEQLGDYINREIRRGQNARLLAADGDVLLLTATSAGKLSDNHTSDGRTMSPDAYERKVNAATHIDELVQVSRRKGNVKADVDGRHGSMASGGWEYRSAFFRDFDSKYYEVSISAAKNADGVMVYNIGRMKEEAFPKIKGSSATNGNGPRGNASVTTVSHDSGNVKQRFSLKSPLEETKDLVALHNLTEDNLFGALDLGGLPSPSIAITKSEMGHTKYGPISLVFSKDTVDPQLFRSNKVYGSDAWTPTAPAVEYPVNSKKLTAVEQEFHKLAKNTDVAGGIFGNSSSIRGMGVDDVSGKSTADLSKALAQTDTIRAAYLADQGKTLEPVKQTKVWDRYGNNSLRSFVDQVGSQRLAEMMTALELGENSQTALGQDAETLDGILRDYYKQSGEAMLQRMAVRKKWTAQEIKEQRQARIDRAMENVTTFAKEDFIRHAWEMYQDGGATKGEIDRLATSEALRAAVNDSDVEAWVTQKLDGLLGEPGIYNGKDRYTASGNTRTFKQTHYDYTLENIVKAMKENQQAKGEGIWGASAGSLMAVATPEYGSIDEIRADKGRIRSASEEEYNRIKDQLREQIDQVILGIRKTNRAMTDNQFEEIDHIGSALIDGAKGKQTPAAIRKAFQEYGYTVGDNLIVPIQQLYKAAADTPTEYFEAKPQRAVGFDEVLAAVVPDNASEKLVDALGEKGVRVIPYEAGNDTDRIQKVNSVEGAKFSLKKDNLGRNLTEQQQEYFKDSKVRDENGALKVMYQGGTGDFTVFDRKKSSYANLYGRGFYFTDSQSHAAQYGNTRSFYLNIQNPVSTDQLTITKQQMRNFLKAVAENDEDFSFENYGQNATVDSVLNSIYGKNDFAMLTDVNQTAIGDMVEAVKLFNEVNGTNFDGLILPTETVTFRSNQAKNIDNANPTQDPDIRFSLKGTAIDKEYADLVKENRMLQERLDYWKGQTKLTKEVAIPKAGWRNTRTWQRFSAEGKKIEANGRTRSPREFTFPRTLLTLK